MHEISWLLSFNIGGFHLFYYGFNCLDYSSLHHNSKYLHQYKFSFNNINWSNNSSRSPIVWRLNEERGQLFHVPVYFKRSFDYRQILQIYFDIHRYLCCLCSPTKYPYSKNFDKMRQNCGLFEFRVKWPYLALNTNVVDWWYFCTTSLRNSSKYLFQHVLFDFNYNWNNTLSYRVCSNNQECRQLLHAEVLI